MPGERRDRSVAETATRRLIHETLPYPGRFRLAVSAGKLGRPFQRFLPGDLGAMLDLLPTDLPVAEPLPALIPAQGTRRARVALLTGCVQQVLAPAINWATLRVLALNGVEVVIPAGQGCCGALSMHTGEADQARSLARHQFAGLPGGCGRCHHQRGGLRLRDARISPPLRRAAGGRRGRPVCQKGHGHQHLFGPIGADCRRRPCLNP